MGLLLILFIKDPQSCRLLDCCVDLTNSNQLRVETEVGRHSLIMSWKNDLKINNYATDCKFTVFNSSFFLFPNKNVDITNEQPLMMIVNSSNNMEKFNSPHFSNYRWTVELLTTIPASALLRRERKSFLVANKQRLKGFEVEWKFNECEKHFEGKV